jgi:hypothetical protein
VALKATAEAFTDEARAGAADPMMMAERDFNAARGAIRIDLRLLDIVLFAVDGLDVGASNS